MRKAGRALKYVDNLDLAGHYLAHRGRQGVALEWLINFGNTVCRNLKRREVAKRFILQRTIHARKWVHVTSEAHQYLSVTAIGHIKELDAIDRANAAKKARDEMIEQAKLEGRLAELEAEEAEAAKLLAEQTSNTKPKQADIAMVFKMETLKRKALSDLRHHAKRSHAICDRLDAAQATLLAQAGKAVRHSLTQDDAIDFLRVEAKRGIDYGNKRDQAELSLLRMGGNACRYLERRDDCFIVLQTRGKRAVVFINQKMVDLEYLSTMGQWKLQYLNAREDAYAYTKRRQFNAVKMVRMKKEAIEWLMLQPKGIWENEANLHVAQAWLGERAKKATTHLDKQQKCFLRLQVGGLPVYFIIL